MAFRPLLAGSDAPPRNRAPRRPNEDVDPMAQRAAEALEKMWDIARARSITDEDVLAEIQALPSQSLSRANGKHN